VSQMWGLALADFGCDPHSSDSLTGNVFQNKTQKLLKQFSGLATSGRRNSAMITDRRKFTSNWSHYGMSGFHFLTVRINSKSFPWDVFSVQDRYLPKFSATSDVRYCALKPIVGYAAVLVRPSERYIEEKQTELETENK